MASRCFALRTGKPTWVDYFLYARIHPVVVFSQNDLVDVEILDEGRDLAASCYFPICGLYST